jgi:Fur family transcriptional regulator, zinc uptake regulator
VRRRSEREDRNPRDMMARTLDCEVLQNRARLHAASKGVPFTPMRQRALALFGTAHKPLTLSEIAEEIKVHRVQVYRLLEFLQEAGCIHWLASRSLYLFANISIQRERRLFL